MEGNQEGIELMDYLEVLWKKKWLIVIPTLLLMIAAGVISFLITPVYEIDSILSPCKAIYKSYQRGLEEILLVSPEELAGKINQKVYLKVISEEMGIEMSDMPNIKAEVPDNSDLVRVTIRHKNTNRGKEVLEHLISQIKKEMDERIDMELKDIDRDIAWIKRQIEETRMDIDAQYIEKKRLQEMISSKKNRLMISKKREETISNEKEEVKKKIGEIENNKKKLLTQESGRENTLYLLLYSNEVQNNFRYYNELDRMLSDEKINQEKLNLEIQHSRGQLKLIDNEIKKLESRISGTEVQMESLKEEKKRIEPVKLIKPPASALKPVSPNIKLNIVLTGILSLFIFTTLAFFIAHIEKKKREK